MSRECADVPVQREIDGECFFATPPNGGWWAVRRFEIPPARQAQVDWSHLGTLEMEGEGVSYPVSLSHSAIAG